MNDDRKFTLLATLWTLIISIVEVWKYLNLNDSFDLGDFTQAVWSSTKGLPLLIYSTPWNTSCWPAHYCPDSFLAEHFMPLLFGITPFYALDPTPIVLLLFQSLALGLSVIPVYLFGKRVLDSRLALLFSFAYLCNPLLIMSSLNDFHVEIFLIPTLAFTFYYGYFKNWKWFTVSAILACLVMEEAPFLVASIILFLIWDKKFIGRRQVLLAVVGLGLVGSYYILVSHLQAYFGYAFTNGVDSRFESNWQILGATSLVDVIPQALTHPALAWQALTYLWPWKFIFTSLLFGGSFFLAIVKPKSLIMWLPWNLPILFSNYIGYFSPYNFYIAFTFFFVFPMAMVGYSDIKKRVWLFNTSIAKQYFVFALLFVAALNLLVPLLIVTPTINYASSSDWRLLNSVPNNASFVSVSDAFPPLANRADGIQVLLGGFALNATPPSQLRDNTLLLQDFVKMYGLPDFVILSQYSKNPYDYVTSQFLIEQLIVPDHYHSVMNSTRFQLYTYT